MEAVVAPQVGKSGVGSYYPQAHLWLVLPFVITLLGFYFSYWSRFTEVPFRFHAHGLTATAWYLLLIIQPWLYHKMPVKYHRKVGFIGLILAGGVVFSAFQMIPFNIMTELPFRYGFCFFDFVSIIAFSFAVAMVMIHSKNLAKHS